jgi:hypothetical protein
MAPYIAAPVPAESAPRAAGAVSVTEIAVTGKLPEAGEAAAKVIVAKTIASAAASITAAGMRAGGKPGTSENKENRKN